MGDNKSTEKKEYTLRIPVVVWRGRSFNLVNFGIFASIGSMVGYSISFFYLQTRGIPVEHFCWEMALVLNLFNLLFAKLFAAFSIGISEYFKNFKRYFNETTFYHQGGMIGLILGGIVLFIFLKIPVTVIGDAMCLGGIATMSIGRIGCHHYGCCTGRPTQGRFAIIYKDPDAKICNVYPGLQNTPLIPVQLISSALDFLIFAGCCLVTIHHPVSGLIMVIFMVGVNLKRILIQNFRLKSTSNKLPYKWIAFSILISTLLIMSLFYNRGESFFQKETPVLPFTWANYFRFLVSDIHIFTSLIFVAVINFIAYGIHGRKIGTHTNLVV